MENYLYQENQKTHPLIVLILVVPVLIILGIIFFPTMFNGGKAMPLPTNAVLFAVIIVESIILYNFYQLRIRVTDKFLMFGFGWFKKRILLGDIKECLIQDYKLGRYGGYGIRIGWDKSVGYVARGGRGVRVNTIKKNYFISSDNPEQFSGILKNLINK